VKKGRRDSLRVYFLRHAEAEDAEEYPGADLARPLTDDGRKAARRMGRWLRGAARPPEVIVSSEAIRAVQTARQVAREVEAAQLRTTSALNPGCTVRQFSAVLQTLRSGGCTAAVLVGHEPDLSSMVASLTSGGRLRIRLRKGAVAEVEIPARGGAVLRSLIAADAV
jgi:phosphohistidine phosphatase